MSEAQEKVAAAVESVAASEEIKAEAAVESATAVVAEKTTQAAAVTVAAAEGAVALANVESAKASQSAAATIQETEGELLWLKENAATVANSFQQLEQRLTQQEQTLANLPNQIAALLTPPQSAEIVDPSKAELKPEAKEGPTKNKKRRAFI